MRALLDTCVLSELVKPAASEGVLERVKAIPDEDLYLSVITVGEIAKGVALLEASRKKRDYARFLAGLESQFPDRILDIDSETARIWGELSANARRQGNPVPALDGLIAATAVRHGLTVLTRNTAHFANSGAMIVNPWQDT